MKVLLIKPSNLSDHIQPSLGLGYIAAQIRDDHEVRIVDCIKEQLPGPQLLPVLEEFRPEGWFPGNFRHTLRRSNSQIERRRRGPAGRAPYPVPRAAGQSWTRPGQGPNEPNVEPTPPRKRLRNQ